MTRYLVMRRPGEYVVGVKTNVLTRGNNVEYPTFELEDGTLFSCHKSKVQIMEDNDGDESTLGNE